MYCNSSITVGKDADFLMLEIGLTSANHSGISQKKPLEMYFSGEKMN